jgi:N-methylhydantoinase A
MREYERTFGHVMEDVPEEIVSIRAALRTPLPRRARESVAGETVRRSRDEIHSTPDVYSFTRGAWLPFRVLQRAGLEIGTTLEGPAIILEETATTYLDAGFSARVDPSGALFLGNATEAS